MAVVSTYDVAIIGMSCLFPGAPTLDAFWQNIVSKVDATSDPPAEAWDADVFYDPDSTSTDRVYCKRGGFIGPIARFDPLAHGIVPLAVEGGEPDQWLALQLAHDALADAGYADRPMERQQTAVILGKGTYINRGNLSLIQHGLMVEQVIQVLRSLHASYSEDDFEAVRQELRQSLPPLNTDTASALIPNVIAGRIANRLDLMGPSYTVDAACASSLVAVEIAMRELRDGQCAMALVGGAQVTTPIPILTLFCQLNALSHREQLRAFDANADGTVLGEGIGMLVLKRLADAERDGDRIYAVIKGVGTASDGRAVSVMAPRLEGEALALRRAYEMAGIEPSTVELIEAHGTGTLVGDVIEVQALSSVFGPRERPYPRCGLGTVKTMIGHTMPASGIAGIIKAALALYHKTLPPTLHCDTPNPRLELEKTPFYVNSETRPWIHGTQESPRRAGVNAFGFGGINAHVVLEEYPAHDSAAPHSHHLHWDSEACILRAATRDALLQRIGQVEEHLDANPDCHLKDVAYTLNVATPDAPWRLAIVATSPADLRQKLTRARQRLAETEDAPIKDVRGIYFAGRPIVEPDKLAMLFPGEGSQYVNMLADLCIHFPVVRECFDQIDRVYLNHPRKYLPSDVIFPCPGFSKEERLAAAKRLWQMDCAIEAVLTANHALFQLLARLGIRPDAILGHSTGDYSALRAAGIIDLNDEAVYTRFLQDLNQAYEQELALDGVPRAALLAIGAKREQALEVMAQAGGELYIAMDNCRHQTVIAGALDAVERAGEIARRRGYIHEMLPFDRAYHTPLFAAYADGLRRIYADLPFSAPRTTIYSCLSVGVFPSDPEQIRELALEHWVKPVEFSKTIEAMYDAGIRTFVEVGPKGNLTAFVEDVLGERPYLAVPTNVARRSGIAGINHMVAMLAAHGVPMTLDYLYQRRRPQRLPLDQPEGTAATARRDTSRALATGWPQLRLSDELTERLRAKEMPPSHDGTSAQPEYRDESAGTVEPGSAGVPPAPVPGTGGFQPVPVQPGGRAGRPSSQADNSQVAHEPAPLPAAAAPMLVHPDGTPVAPLAAQAMHTYLSTMDAFVDVQAQLMESYVRSASRRRAARQAIDEGA